MLPLCLSSYGAVAVGADQVEEAPMRLFELLEVAEEAEAIYQNGILQQIFQAQLPFHQVPVVQAGVQLQ